MADSVAIVDPPVCTAPIDFSKSINRACLKGQSALVTGGAVGIGGAFVEALASAGAYVTAVDIDAEQGEILVARLTDQGHKVQFIQCDVRSWEDQVKAFQAAVDFSPAKTLDIVIPSAGVIGQGISAWLDEVNARGNQLSKPDTRLIEINLVGVWYSTYLAMHHFRQTLQHARPSQKQAKSKQIVYIGSTASFSPSPYNADYGASKFGVRGVWRSIRDDKLLLQNDNVTFRTSLIAPTFIKSPMAEDFIAQLEEIGAAVGETSDCVEALLRIICDEEVRGRAICVLPHGKSFDVCDDFDGSDGGREYWKNVVNGAFGHEIAKVNELFGPQTKSASNK